MCHKNHHLSSFWLILGKNIEIFSTAIKMTACENEDYTGFTNFNLI